MSVTWLRSDPSISVGFVGSIGRACFSDLLLRTGPEVDIAYRSGSRTALLAALAAGRLDLAVCPGQVPAGLRTVLLCEDHVVVALAAVHPLASAAAIAAVRLAAEPVLLPVIGEHCDFRRLVRERLPSLREVTEQPMAAVVARLAAADTLALIAAGQEDELGAGLVTRPIAGVDTAFPVRLAWAEPARRPAAAALADLLARACTDLSPPAASTPIVAGGGRGDGDGDAGARCG